MAKEWGVCEVHELKSSKVSIYCIYKCEGAQSRVISMYVTICKARARV